MKTLITNYAFDAAAQTITFGDYVSIVAEDVMLITNVTDNVIIYNFADPTKGGTVATNVLTLAYDTTSMANTDDLQIWYWDSAKSAATEAKQDDAITQLTNIDGGKLEEDTFTGRVGEVQDAPTQFTVLDRLKTVGVEVNSLRGDLQDPSNSAQLGSTSETAPASDTATSGLNGRLQRLAQRISTLLGYFREDAGSGMQGILSFIKDDEGGSQPMLGDTTGRPHVVVESAPTTAVTGTFWQATQPVSGTVTANTGLSQPLTDTQLRATPVPVSGTFYQATQPVSGTVTEASASAIKTAVEIMDDWDESDRAKVNLIAGQAGITAGAGAVAANTPRVTHASDDPVTTALQLIDDPVIADDAAFTPATSKVMMAGFEVDETSTDSVDEGDAGAARMTPDRKQIVTSQAHTNGGATPYVLISAASTNATSLKNAAGMIYSIQVGSINAAARYLKLYDKSSAPTVGTDTPIKVITIPGATAGAGNNPIFPVGIVFTNGIAFALTTGIAHTDTGAVAANEITVNIDYK